MPYIGRDLNRGNYLKLDDISSSFNGSTQTFNLTVGGSAFTPGSAFSILVSVGGVIQEPESAYQINNSEITFANAPTAQDSFFCIALGVSLGIGVPGNGTVNGTQMAKPFNYDGFFFLDDANNRVGIGSTQPTVALDVDGIIKASSFNGGVSAGVVTCTGLDLNGNGDVSGNFVIDGDLTVNGTTSTIDTNLIGVDRIEVTTALTNVAVAVTHNGTGDLVRLYDGASQVVTIDDTGNVGIGSAIPASLLNLASSNPLIRLTDTDTNAHSTIGGEGGNLYLYTNSSSRDFIFRGSQEVARITGDGTVGIGTHTPIGDFTVKTNGMGYFGIDGGGGKGAEFNVYHKDTKANTYKFANNGGSNELAQYSLINAGGKHIWNIGGTTAERMRLDTTGVGIGTIPNDIDSIGEALNIASSTGGAIYLQDTDAPTVKFGAISYNGATAALQIHAHHASSYIDLGTDGQERLRIDSDGKITIAAAGKVGFATDSNTYFEQDGLDRLSFTVGGVKTVSMIEGTNLPVLLVDDGGVNTSSAQQGAGYNANANANDIVIGNVTSGNHGLTICSPSSGYGSINFSDGSGGGLDASRGQIFYEHTPEELILRAKIGKIMLRNDSTDALVASGGKIGIGTDNPNNPLTIHGSGNQIYLKDTATDNNLQIRHSGGVAEFNSFGTGGARRPFVFNQYASEVLRINSGGDVILGGHDSVIEAGGYASHLEVHGTATDAGISIYRYSNDSGSPTLLFGKSRGSSIGSFTTVHENDSLGKIEFYGTDTDWESSASIRASADGEWRSGSVGAEDNTDSPGRLEFHTTPNGADNLQERLRISSDGKIKFATNNSTTDYFEWGGNPRLYLKVPSGTNGLRIDSDTTPLEIRNSSANGRSLSFGSGGSSNFDIILSGDYSLSSSGYDSTPRIFFNTTRHNGSTTVTSFQCSIQGVATSNTNNTGYLGLGASASPDDLTIRTNSDVCIGNFTTVDTRNTGGLHIQANKGISFRAYGSASDSRNWRIRNDDSAWGNLDFTVGDNNSTDIGSGAADTVLSLAANHNVGINEVSPDKLLHLSANNTSVSANAFTSANNTIRFTDTDTTVTSNQPGGTIEWETLDSNAAGVNAYIATKNSNTGYSSMHFATGNTTTLGVRLNISQEGHITPGNNSQNIGDGTTNFASIWASTRFRGNDNVKLVLGASQNLVVRYDGSNNIIGSPVGNHLHIKSGIGDNDNQFCAKFNHNSSVQLYHNNQHVFDTTSTGFTAYGGGTNSNGQINIQPRGTGVYATLSFKNSSGGGEASIGTHSGADTIYYVCPNHLFHIGGAYKLQMTGSVMQPYSGVTNFDLGSSSNRFQNIYTGDLDLSNETKGGNDVDGTWGSYTIQEGENDLFLINKRSGKKYKFNLTEVS